MVDTHTHILPGIDDGAKDVDMSIALLRQQQQQGVDTVVLTPHFYRDMEGVTHFLHRREKALFALEKGLSALSTLEQRTLPHLRLGAEVAWVPNMHLWPHLKALCIEGTEYLLLEPPIQPWSEQSFHELYDLMEHGNVTPIIAHIDRYFSQKETLLEKLYSVGIPIQISASAILSPLTRRRALNLIETGVANLIISDCHDPRRRPPNMGDALELVERKLGPSIAGGLIHQTDQFAARIQKPVASGGSSL